MVEMTHVEDLIQRALAMCGSVYKDPHCGCAAWSHGETFVLRSMECTRE